MRHSFLGLEFTPIKLNHRDLLADFLRKHPQPLSGYTASSLIAWQEQFHYGWVFPEPEVLLISCLLSDSPHRYLMQPIGFLSASFQDRLLREAAKLPFDLTLIGIGERFFAEYPHFVRNFETIDDRAAANYIYRAGDLARLPGRKYARKRNLLAQAASQYHWSTESLTAELTDLCFKVLEDIRTAQQPELDASFRQELAALEFTLQHYGKLELQGVLIRVNSRPVAFSIYEAISPNTVAIHFERALRNYKGLYQIINCETAKLILAKGYEYINREEDLGNPGLRDAKLSYQPFHLAPSYRLKMALIA